MSEDNTLKEIKAMLSEYPKEIQDLMTVSGFLHLDVQNAIDNHVSTKQNLLDEITKEAEKLTLTELALLQYLIKTINLSKECKIATKLNIDMEKLKQESYEEGFNKGKELRIKELKKMREF